VILDGGVIYVVLIACVNIFNIINWIKKFKHVK